MYMHKYACLPNNEVRFDTFSVSPVQPAHIELIRCWRNEQMDVLRQSKLISHGEQLAYFENEIWPSMPLSQPRQILLSIFENDLFIGYGGLVHISWSDLRAEVSFLIDSQRMLDAATVDRCFSSYLRLIKEVAFRDLGFNRLVTETFAHRSQLILLLERSGFKYEGRMREHVTVNGTFTDSLIHGCLARDES